MVQQADNMQKYLNYKEQMGRLKKAIANSFYLEAIFIEYAIIEDRLESKAGSTCVYREKDSYGREAGRRKERTCSEIF